MVGPEGADRQAAFVRGVTTAIAGDPDVAVAKFDQAGVEHLVFDFRFEFGKWFEQIELLGTEVLPDISP